MKQKSITRLTFEDLSAGEQSAVSTGVRILNTLDRYKTAEGVDAEAFQALNATLRWPEANYLWQDFMRRAKRAGWSDEEIRGEKAAEIEKKYNAEYMLALAQMREALRELASSGRTPERRGAFASLVATVNQDMAMYWQGGVVNGRANVVLTLKFRSALGLIAHAILRIASLDPPGRKGSALLECKECGRINIVRATGGARITEFCNAQCRNRFGQRALRRRRARMKKAAGRHK